MRSTVVRAGLAVLLVPIAGIAGAPEAAADASTFSNTTSITIPHTGNATPYPSPIVVAGASGPITDVNVTISGYSHEGPDDMGAVLVAPNGDAILLVSGAGDLTDASNLTWTFDDFGSSHLPTSGALSSGTWKPTNYYPDDSFPDPGPGTAYGNPGPSGNSSLFVTLASVFNGDDPNGTWNLFVRDFTAGDTGVISGGWSITFNTPPPVDGTVTVGTSGNGSGTITASGINCPGDCSETYTGGTSVTLTPHPAAGSTFGGFGGACTGTARCTFTVNGDSSVSAVFSDAAPPQTSLASHPPKKTTKKKATFTFSANETASFQCSLDGSAFASCTSPTTRRHLSKGKHTFKVRAVDRVGRTDATPAEWKWKVKKRAG